MHTRSISHEKVCNLSAINDKGDSCLRASSRSKPTTTCIVNSLRGLVEGSWVTTDELHQYESALAELGVGEHIAVKSEEAKLSSLI